MNLRRDLAIALGMSIITGLVPVCAQAILSKLPPAINTNSEHTSAVTQTHKKSLLEIPFKLSDAQAEKLYAIETSTHNQLGPRYLELKSLQSQINDLLTQPSLDRTDIANLQNQIIADKTAIEIIKGNSKIYIAEVLTPEQRHTYHEHKIRSLFEHSDSSPDHF